MRGIRIFEIMLLIFFGIATFGLIVVIWVWSSKSCDSCKMRSWFHGPILRGVCKWCREEGGDWRKGRTKD